MKQQLLPFHYNHCSLKPVEPDKILECFPWVPKKGKWLSIIIIYYSCEVWMRKLPVSYCAAFYAIFLLLIFGTLHQTNDLANPWQFFFVFHLLSLLQLLLYPPAADDYSNNKVSVVLLVSFPSLKETNFFDSLEVTVLLLLAFNFSWAAANCCCNVCNCSRCEMHVSCKFRMTITNKYING